MTDESKSEPNGSNNIIEQKQQFTSSITYKYRHRTKKKDKENNRDCW